MMLHGVERWQTPVGKKNGLSPACSPRSGSSRRLVRQDGFWQGRIDSAVVARLIAWRLSCEQPRNHATFRSSPGGLAAVLLTLQRGTVNRLQQRWHRMFTHKNDRACSLLRLLTWTSPVLQRGQIISAFPGVSLMNLEIPPRSCNQSAGLCQEEYRRRILVLRPGMC